MFLHKNAEYTYSSGTNISIPNFKTLIFFFLLGKVLAGKVPVGKSTSGEKPSGEKSGGGKFQGGKTLVPLKHRRVNRNYEKKDFVRKICKSFRSDC